MAKKIITVLSLALLAQTLSAGQAAPPLKFFEGQSGTTQPGLPAKKFPEIRLITTAGESHLGKLTGLEGEIVTLLPFPYWNLEPVKINVRDIHLIQFSKRGSRVGKGFLTGFGYGFVTVGFLLAISSQYDEDYKFALGATPMAGVMGGLIGALIGAIGDAASRSKYEFYKMNLAEKFKAVRNIMGY